ncbi:CNNM domain-containing protein [Streptomyces sp. NPDC008265]|uniref:hemolysin family protein n=1 Tax=Streptomyces sp. NPDC008265 TaxID=3364824 RepID=UPI0036E75BBC
MTTVQLLIGALTLVTNAFFVGAEFAMISVRRSQIEPAALKGNRRARTTLWGLEHLSALMATAQLGITVSSLVLGAVAEPAIAHLLEPPFAAIGVPEALIHPIAFVIALTLATYLHMLIGEMVPKNIALAAPAPTALLLGPPLVALTRALRPLIFGINAFANTLLRLLKVEPKDEVAAVFTDGELARLVKDSRDAGLLAPEDSERLQDALELGTRKVGEIMIPRPDFVTVEQDITPRGLERTAARHGFSRLVVTGTGGSILGFLHIKDALAAIDRSAPFPRTALHTVTRVPVDTPLDDTMTAMRDAGTHLAAVTDEDGTVVGYVTMEDVLEELVGEAAAPGSTR